MAQILGSNVLVTAGKKCILLLVRTDCNKKAFMYPISHHMNKFTSQQNVAKKMQKKRARKIMLISFDYPWVRQGSCIRINLCVRKKTGERVFRTYHFRCDCNSNPEQNKTWELMINFYVKILIGTDVQTKTISLFCYN